MAFDASARIARVIFSLPSIPDNGIDDIIQLDVCLSICDENPTEFSRIHDSPSGCRINVDEPFVPSWDLCGVTIPPQDPFLVTIHFLNDGDLEVEARLGLWLSDNLSELGDYHLVPLADRVEGA